MTIEEEIRQLAPWHLDVQVTPELSTSVAEGLRSRDDAENTDGPVGFINPRSTFMQLCNKIYPDGLHNKSFLDCACNCGGYSFWARELGAQSCLGFDVREHWIRQARFLHKARNEDPEVEFKILDIYDLPTLERNAFELTIFKGIFYHLPDPVTALKIVAEMTSEVLILNTATRKGVADGMLAIGTESRKPLMSGVHGLNWFPTGPVVLKKILNWLGFSDVRLVYDIEDANRPDYGRIEIVASKIDGLLDSFEKIT